MMERSVRTPYTRAKIIVKGVRAGLRMEVKTAPMTETLVAPRGFTSRAPRARKALALLRASYRLVLAGTPLEMKMATPKRTVKAVLRITADSFTIGYGCLQVYKCTMALLPYSHP